MAKLTAAQLRRFHHGLAKSPPRVRTKAGAPPAHREIDVTDSESVRRRQSSANRILTTLKAALNYCFSEKLAASDAEWRRVKPFRNVESARVRYLQVAEAKRFINACDSVFRPLAQAALQTGCRYGELARLKVGDFKGDSNTLAIWQSKSGKPRHVILTTEGAAFFAELCAGRASGELMLRRANGEPWRKSNQAEFMAAACARAKIAADKFSRAAPHLGELGDHGRNAAAGCRAQFRSRRHAKWSKPTTATYRMISSTRRFAHTRQSSASSRRPTSACCDEGMEGAGLARRGTVPA